MNEKFPPNVPVAVLVTADTFGWVNPPVVHYSVHIRRITSKEWKASFHELVEAMAYAQNLAAVLIVPVEAK